MLQRTSSGSFVNSSDPKGYAIEQFIAPRGIVCNELGEIFVITTGNDKIIVAEALRGFSLRGFSGETGTSLGQFQRAVNLCIGDRGICVADAGNDRVQFFEPAKGGRVDLTPFIPRFAVSKELGLKRPGAVAWLNDLLEEKIYIADTGNDRVILVQLSTESPISVWNAMKRHLLRGDIDGALAHFSRSSSPKYHGTYYSIGAKALMGIFSQIPPIELVFIHFDRAQYRFEQMVQGFRVTFPIDFVKEDGRWKIERY